MGALIVFLVVLSGASFLLHHLIVLGLGHAFGFGFPWPMLIVYAFNTADFIVVHFVARRVWNVFVQIWYVGTVMCVGVLVILLLVVGVYGIVQWVVGQFVAVPPAVYQVGVIGATVLLFAYSLVNGRRMRVREITIRSKKVKRLFTVVHLSDLHLGSIHREGFVEEVVAKTNALGPDVVVSTGDLIDVGTTDETLAGFGGVEAPTFAVSGNHDTYFVPQGVGELLGKTPIREITEQKSLVGDAVQVVGLDLPGWGGRKKIGEVLAGLSLDEGRYTIVLSHEPISFRRVEGHGVDLLLAGHIHAGQIFPWNLVAALFYRYSRGLYRSGDRAIHVSPGTGTWGPPMRLGSRNEITAIRVLPEAGGE